jgi:CO dehydrogenase maturation factor
MGKQIAVAGKGGTGKTTFTSLLIGELVKMKKGDILAVDADPNSNLNEALGIEVTETIADLLNETKGGGVPAGMTKDVFVEYKLQQILRETENYDLLVMGPPQGGGCYCYPNDLMKKYLEKLRENYDYVLIDNEAGLEHLSRKIITDIDTLFVVSDSSARGVRSAGRVYDIVKSVNIDVKNIYLIVTRTQGEGLGALQAEVDKTGIPLIGTIPYDPLVVDADLNSEPLVNLPDDSVALQAVREIIKKAGI